MLGTFGWTELLIILVIIVILFGGSRIAGLGGSLGKSIKEFRTAMKEEDQDPESDGEKKEEAAAPASESSDVKQEASEPAASTEDAAKKS